MLLSSSSAAIWWTHSVSKQRSCSHKFQQINFYSNRQIIRVSGVQYRNPKVFFALLKAVRGPYTKPLATARNSLPANQKTDRKIINSQNISNIPDSRGIQELPKRSFLQRSSNNLTQQDMFKWRRIRVQPVPENHISCIVHLLPGKPKSPYPIRILQVFEKYASRRHIYYDNSNTKYQNH